MVVFQIGNRHFSLEEFRLYELEHTKTRNYYDFRIISKRVGRILRIRGFKG